MRALLAAAGACALLSTSCVATEAAGPSGPAASVPPPPDAYAVPAGQWVQTQQYGWVWMPYADPYTYVPPDGYGEPLEYVYYPSVGWAWVSAPWVWGVGPMPAFGRPGPRRYVWYERGWWRTPQRWHYRAAPERPGYASRGVRAPPLARPAPARPAPAAAPQARVGRPNEGRSGERRDGDRAAAPAPRPAPREGERTRGEGRDRGEDRQRPERDTR